MNDLLEILINKGLKIYSQQVLKNEMWFECDVYAKPGSKKESLVISNDGVLVVKTRARPVEGEANKAIVEMLAGMIGISKSNLAIIRGDKSKHKRIKILVEITANKNASYYREKFTSILTEEV